LFIFIAQPAICLIFMKRVTKVQLVSKQAKKDEKKHGNSL
jgi:hypothetical protein